MRWSCRSSYCQVGVEVKLGVDDRLDCKFLAFKTVGDDYPYDKGNPQVGSQGDTEHEKGHKQVFAISEVLDHESKLQAGKYQQDSQ